MFDYLGLRVLHVTVERPFHIIVFAQKISLEGFEKVHSENDSCLQASAEWRKRDPIGGVSTLRLASGGERSQEHVESNAHA
jgi:hypothetical protein